MIGEKLHRTFMSRGLKQGAVALITGVDQSQVSRICKGRFRTTSHNLIELCKYANIDISVMTEQATIPYYSDGRCQGTQMMLNAINEIWDGSVEHAIALSELIRATRNFRRCSIEQ